MHSLFKGVIRGYLLAFVVERRNFNIHGTFALHKNIFKSVKKLSNVIVPKGGFHNDTTEGIFWIAQRICQTNSS